MRELGHNLTDRQGIILSISVSQKENIDYNKAYQP